MIPKPSTKEHVAALREKNSEVARVLYDELREKFSDREACFAELCRIFHVEQRCNNCLSVDIEVIENGRAGKCFQCKSNTWFTADTILAHIKKIEARLAAILLTTAGVVLNSEDFSKLVHISQSSALGILNWLRITVLPLLSQNSELVHSSHFSLVFRRRSRETPAGAHPVAEQQAIEEMEAKLSAQNSGSDINGKSIDGNIEPTSALGNNNEDPALELEAQRILHLLGLNTELSFDQICNNSAVEVGTLIAILTVLELNDRVKCLPGDYYIRNKPKPKPAIPNKQIIDAIESFIHFVQSFFGGISRRYLQPYLSAFWIYKAASNPAQNDAKLGMHNLEKSVYFNSVKDFVTPLWVNFSFS